jgi:pimeloyl-[acyl-carrier protein] methyl ester esterase
MTAPSLLLIHGWGFDPSLWTPLRAALADWASDVVDLGYFGAPHSAVPPGAVVAVGHSLGAMLALGDPPPQCVGLVAINGFDRFTARGGGPGVGQPVNETD